MNVDGVKVYSYSMEPEGGKIGVFSHELGHVFGLPDLYDYGYDSKGIGYWSLMAGGSWGGGGTRPIHPDAWSKIQLGWVPPATVTTNMDNAQIPQVETSPTVYKLWRNGQPDKEYFLVENRQKVGFDGLLPGAGLLIWHIDDNKLNNDEQWYPELPPANHYKVAVEPADGQWHLEKNINSGDSGDPFPCSTNNTAFNDTSTPDSKAYLTGSTKVGVVDISNSGATMTATFSVVPSLDVKANGFDGTITITTTTTLSVTVELDAGDYAGDNVDWWHVAKTPFGWYRYNVSTKTWVPCISVTYQSPLFDITTPIETLKMSGLPPGTYTFYFGVDLNMNGSIDFDKLYFDQVVVVVE